MSKLMVNKNGNYSFYFDEDEMEESDLDLWNALKTKWERVKIVKV